MRPFPIGCALLLAAVGCSSSSSPAPLGLSGEDAGADPTTPPPSGDAGVVASADATIGTDAELAPDVVVGVDVSVHDAGADVVETFDAGPSCAPYLQGKLADGAAYTYFADGSAAPPDPCHAYQDDAGAPFPFACEDNGTPGNGVVHFACVTGAVDVSCCQCTPDPGSAGQAACEALDAGHLAAWSCFLNAAAPQPCTLVTLSGSTLPEYCCPSP